MASIAASAHPDLGEEALTAGGRALWTASAARVYEDVKRRMERSGGWMRGWSFVSDHGEAALAAGGGALWEAAAKGETERVRRLVAELRVDLEAEYDRVTWFRSANYVDWKHPVRRVRATGAVVTRQW